MVKHHLWKLIVAVALAATLTAPGVSATSTVFQSPPPVPPPNDNFSSATVITNRPFSDSVDMTYATIEANEPQYCNGASKTVWYAYTPSASQVVKVTWSGFPDVNLVIFQAYGSAITDLSYINCGSGGSPLLTFNANAGTTYYFQVGLTYGYNGQTGQLTIETVLPPANDSFSNATDISETPFYQQMDATNATTEAGEPMWSCGYAPQHTVWYKYTAPANGVVDVSLTGSNSDSLLNAYRADGVGFGGLSPVLGCANNGYFYLTVQANETYYFQAGTAFSTGGNLSFSMSVIPPLANDNFVDAKLITALPYDDNTDMTAASTQAGEPTSSCGSASKTIWYAYTPTTSGSFSQRTNTWWPETVVAVYTGSSLSTLQQVACRYRYYDSSLLTFHADAGTVYYFQVGTYSNAWVPFYLDVAPLPEASFWYSPYDPTVFDNIYFYNNSWDPAGIGIQSALWNFGDGTTSTDWSPAHRYAADGDHTVNLTVNTPDGRTASTSQTVRVKTHDVAITKFSAPQSASAGQTRQLVVGLNSKIYPEKVRVEFYKSVPGGYALLGYQDQSVPVRSANRTTDFKFSYTFTADDATIGKVTFKAVAWILEARDALPADNESIASPTKVAKK